MRRVDNVFRDEAHMNTYFAVHFAHGATGDAYDLVECIPCGITYYYVDRPSRSYFESSKW